MSRAFSGFSTTFFSSCGACQEGEYGRLLGRYRPLDRREAGLEVYKVLERAGAPPAPARSNDGARRDGLKGRQKLIKRIPRRDKAGGWLRRVEPYAYGTDGEV